MSVHCRQTTESLHSCDTVKACEQEPVFFKVSLNRFLHEMVISTNLGYVGYPYRYNVLIENLYSNLV